MAIKNKSKTKIFSKDEKTSAPATPETPAPPATPAERLSDAAVETVDVTDENASGLSPEAPEPPTPSSAKEAIVPTADIAKPSGPVLNDINVDMDKATINARVIVATNSVIGKKRYTLEKGKTYKLSHNVYNVLKHAGKVL